MRKEIINVDTVYLVFLILSLITIITNKNVADIAYFSIMTFYYVKFKLYKRSLR